MIKNTLRTAVAYADANIETLGARHIIAIIEAGIEEDNENVETANAGERRRREQVKRALEILQHLVGVSQVE